ncbi:MAG: sel1 repeat family protein, partial [Devosiaceae bacterium]|nr:sel1 repeat family protein [Devosiaceae bacterium MH13]
LAQTSPVDTWINDPTAAFAAGTSAYYEGDTVTALAALEAAAEGGHAIARWKLARMYADGDGVAEDDMRAFDYFSQIATAHADDRPDTPQARFVANAFVALGTYYSNGIGDHLAADHHRSRQIYTYAASYFGDPDAQYRLGVMMLNGEGGNADALQAGRWLSLAARKGHVHAQLALGELLFSGSEHLAAHRAEGLKWLIIAGEFAEMPRDVQRVRPLQERYLALADVDLRARAVQMAEEWLTGPEGAAILRLHRAEFAGQ